MLDIDLVCHSYQVVEEYLLSRKGLLFGRLICTALISCPRKVGHYSVLQARKVNPSLDINDILFVSLKVCLLAIAFNT
jgi:hypothetical protein